MEGGMEAIIGDLIDKQLSKDGLRTLAKAVVLLAEKRLPGKTGPEKQAWCIDKVTVLTEDFDNKLPVIGAFMDIPLIDCLERWAIKQLIEWAWGAVQAEKAKLAKQSASVKAV